MLSLLLATHDEDERPRADESLLDEVKTALVAGRETTASALTWTVIELQEDPRVLERLRRELERGDEYPDAMIRESLRLHPIVPTVTRLLRVQRLVSVLLKV